MEYPGRETPRTFRLRPEEVVIFGDIDGIERARAERLRRERGGAIGPGRGFRRAIRRFLPPFPLRIPLYPRFRCRKGPVRTARVRIRIAPEQGREANKPAIARGRTS